MFGNNTFPRHMRHRSNLGYIFGKKSASYGPGNMVLQESGLGLNGSASFLLKQINFTEHLLFHNI